jgi:hypothetical protein
MRKYLQARFPLISVLLWTFARKRRKRTVSASLVVVTKSSTLAMSVLQLPTMSTIKIHLNSTISTADAKYMTMDVVDFYLNNPLPTLEYMRIPIWAIPKVIMDNYKL